MSRIFIIILLMLVLSTGAHATNMGTSLNKNLAKITVENSAKFTILFWNSENDSYQVNLSAKDFPKDWIIIIDPSSFVLNASVGKEYIKLPYKSDYVKAIPVDIIVKPINSTKSGKYDITIIAESNLPKNDIALSQERVFKLSVEVENPLFFEEKSQNTPQIKEDQDKVIEKSILAQKNNNINYYYLISIVIILVISFLIYKYS